MLAESQTNHTPPKSTDQNLGENDPSKKRKRETSHDFDMNELFGSSDEEGGDQPNVDGESAMQRAAEPLLQHHCIQSFL